MNSTRATLGGLFALLSLPASLAACSSTTTSNASCSADGAYELTVVSTGQSGVISDACTVGVTQVVDLTLTGGAVVMNGESCSLCSTSSCQLNVVCGRSVTCPGTVVPVDHPAASYIQSASFVRPGQTDQPTGNAVVTLGPDYCIFTGVAVQKK